MTPAVKFWRNALGLAAACTAITAATTGLVIVTGYAVYVWQHRTGAPPVVWSRR